MTGVPVEAGGGVAVAIGFGDSGCCEMCDGRPKILIAGVNTRLAPYVEFVRWFSTEFRGRPASIREVWLRLQRPDWMCWFLRRALPELGDELTRAGCWLGVPNHNPELCGRVRHIVSPEALEAACSDRWVPAGDAA